MPNISVPTDGYALIHLECAPEPADCPRAQYTHVTVASVPIPQGTRVTIVHDGWGKGGEWEEACLYFGRVWEKTVLPRLKHRFERGPVDW
jgi:hypothetical protein